MIKKIVTSLLVCATLSLSGCCTLFNIGCPPPKPPEKNDPVTVGSRINDTVNRMETNSVEIGKLNNDSAENIVVIQKKIPDSKEAGAVRDNIGKIKLLNDQNLENVPKIENDAILVCEYSKTIASLQDIINRYEDAMYQKQQEIWMMVNTLAAIGLIASIFIAMYWKPSYGLSLGGGCLATIAVATFMGSHIILVAWVGGGILLVIFGLFVFNIVRENMKVKQAFKESVVTTEVSKNEIWSPKMSKKVDALQSPFTKQMVQEVKDDLKKKGYYSLPKKNENSDESSSEDSEDDSSKG